MRVLSVFGITKSGKTTTAEAIIRGLTARRYTVGSVKEIHFEAFRMDTPGTNTDRHRQAGAEPVTALSYHETDILYSHMLPVDEVLSHYSSDFAVLEGVSEGAFPKIITAHTVNEIDERLDPTVFAICGVISNTLTEYKGIPVINALKEPERLVSLIERVTFEKLPGFSQKCCGECGMSCQELCGEIVAGRRVREDCALVQDGITLTLDGKPVVMVPFVQKLVRNAVLGVVGELDGYRKNARIELTID